MIVWDINDLLKPIPLSAGGEQNHTVFCIYRFISAVLKLINSIKENINYSSISLRHCMRDSSQMT